MKYSLKFLRDAEPNRNKQPKVWVQCLVKSSVCRGKFTIMKRDFDEKEMLCCPKCKQKLKSGNNFEYNDEWHDLLKKPWK